MAVSIVNNHKFFANKNNAIILFKDNYKNNEYKYIKKDNDFILIFSNDKICGINIFNYSKYFDLEEGFHVLKNDAKEFLLNKFKEYLSINDFDNFFKVGEVVNIEQHPNTEKLKIISVVFNDGKRQIVTNYQNIDYQKYLFAIEGATTYQGITIKKSKVMDVESQGMLMSYKSIGINKDSIIICNELNIEDYYQF